MLQSEVVKALAAIASKGTYKVGPSDARHMNTVFEEVARVINELEAKEKEVS